MSEERLSPIACLEVLRKSLMIAGGTWLIAFFCLYGFSARFFFWLAAPLQKLLPQGSSLVFLSATEPFFTYLMLAAGAALVVALPVILWQAWTLIVSCQKRAGKALGLIFILGSFASFLTGSYLGFRYVFPVIFSVLIHFGLDAGDIDAMLSMGDYLSLAMKMMLAFGLVFELPVLMIVLTRLGLTDSRWFATKRKYMLIVAFVFGAVITPGPDVLSQSSIAIPFVILYEVGILGARLTEKKQRSGEDAPPVDAPQPGEQTL